MVYITQRWMSHTEGQWVPLSPKLSQMAVLDPVMVFSFHNLKDLSFVSQKRCLKTAIYTKLNVFIANPNNKRHHCTAHVTLILKWNLSSKQRFVRKIKMFFQESSKWEINACFRTLSMFSGHPAPQNYFINACLELWPKCNRWLFLVSSSEDKKAIWNPDSFLEILLYTHSSSSP